MFIEEVVFIRNLHEWMLTTLFWLQSNERPIGSRTGRVGGVEITSQSLRTEVSDVGDRIHPIKAKDFVE